jgi:hypothetical protein
VAPAPTRRYQALHTAALAAALAAAIACAPAAAGQQTLARTPHAPTAVHLVVAKDASARPNPHEVVPAPAAPAGAVVLSGRPASRVPVLRAPFVVVQHRATTPPRVVMRNRLISARGGLNTGVGYYSDCSGRTPLSHASAAIDTCVRGRTFFVGHNPGVFTPLFSLGVGSIITWYDGAGTAHRLRIVAVRVWHHTTGVLGLVGRATVQLQTCITPDGSIDRLLDAAPA